MQLHFLLLTSSSGLRHPRNMEKLKHEELLLSLHPHVSKEKCTCSFLAKFEYPLEKVTEINIFVHESYAEMC